MLGQEILELRQERDKLQEQVARVKKQLEEKPVIIDRRADDARKIREFKGLIRELREEIERLAALVPSEAEPEEESAGEETTAPAVPKEADLSALAGKTILIVGWPNEEITDNYRVVWHDGDKVDQKLQALAREADIFVFLTRFGSHAAMWWLKEEAIEQDKPMHFVWEKNLQRILAELIEAAQIN